MFKSLSKIILVAITLLPLTCSAVCMINYSFMGSNRSDIVIKVGDRLTPNQTDGSNYQVQYYVIADPSNPNFEASVNGYRLTDAKGNIDLPIDLNPNFPNQSVIVTDHTKWGSDNLSGGD